MTKTYTINEAQRLQMLAHAQSMTTVPTRAIEAMLQALTPNEQEPVGYAYANQDFIGSVIGAKGEWAPHEIALYTHPAQPKANEQEPVAVVDSEMAGGISWTLPGDDLEGELMDSAISWCESNGINVLEPNQLSSLVNTLFVAVCDTAPQPTDSEKTWCSYIAGMIGAYLGEPVESDRCKAIAGIIERRLWALPKTQGETK